MARCIMATVGGGADGGVAVVMVMIEATMCMFTVLAEREVVERRMVVAADMRVAVVVMAAASVELPN